MHPRGMSSTAPTILHSLAPLALQGELMNRIENHVLEAQDYVLTAKQDTKKAIRYQNKARRSMTHFYMMNHFYMMRADVYIILSLF
ncbi:hypothetical protein HAZT_HAZT002945 [Hyalella azteca]|uniref:t-SNARE coiled-coil homology domain-containing protein n=1 Tax=Hyalella azteca TaxID=294128 RepID=A0A6A0H548_HYAAZ|nr:hypothetical protein HAZT_HAZT002945 [Hyalella azteca]